jgi:DNA (cytosine-5)-methyltransferase 1
MNHLDLFSGIGGFTLGLKETYFSEIDKYAIDVYKHNFKNSKYVGSITDVRGTELPRINIITFGSPCQDFSLAGKRKGMDGERSSLILEAIRLIKECKPDFFIWENVKGTFSSNSGSDFTAILKAFVDIGGYRLEWQLLNTKWFLPQNRERIYLVGCLGKGSGRQVFPITENNRTINELQGQQANTCTLTTRYEAGGNGSYIIERKLNAQKVMKVVIAAKPTQLGQSKKTYAYKNGTIIGKKNQDAFTIRSANPNGVLVESKIRRLTPIECERLQGFEDDWTKTGEELGTISDSQRYKMCGNAVTVDVVEAVANKIKNAL